MFPRLHRVVRDILPPVFIGDFSACRAQWKEDKRFGLWATFMEWYYAPRGCTECGATYAINCGLTRCPLPIQLDANNRPALANQAQKGVQQSIQRSKLDPVVEPERVPVLGAWEC